MASDFGFSILKPKQIELSEVELLELQVQYLMKTLPKCVTEESIRKLFKELSEPDESDGYKDIFYDPKTNEKVMITADTFKELIIVRYITFIECSIVREKCGFRTIYLTRQQRNQWPISSIQTQLDYNNMFGTYKWNEYAAKKEILERLEKEEKEKKQSA